MLLTLALALVERDALGATPSPTDWRGAVGSTTNPVLVASRDFDLQGFVDQRLLAGEKRIVVPPGQYRVKPRNRVHLSLKDLADVEIVADGVEMICTQTTLAIKISNCRNVTLRGLVIDYDPLPFTQGRITAMSDDRRVHEVELFPGYPTTEQIKNRYEIFRPDTRTLRTSTYSTKFEALDSTHVRVTKIGASAASDLERVGDLIVVSTSFAPDGQETHAIVMDACAHLRLENLTLYASNCFGFFETNCDSTVYDHCKLDRRPAETDLVRRGDPRLRSTNADAYHSKFAVRGPQLIGCVARFQGDDCVNICGRYYLVTHSSGSVLRVLSPDDMNIAPSDPVELCTYEGRRLPDAKAVRTEADGNITADERAFLLRQRLSEFTRTIGLSKAYRITLDQPVDLPMGSVICSQRRTGRGFLVKDCTFGFNRSRGILIKASDGDVVGNTIAGTQMSAILVSPEYWWLEAGSSNNVRIANNTIRDCASPAISVEAHGGTGDVAPAGAHSKIEIVDNRIDDTGCPAIFVTSTDGLRVENNAGSLVRQPSADRWRQKEVPLLPNGEYPPVVTLNCADQTVRQNALTLP